MGPLEGDHEGGTLMHRISVLLKNISGSILVPTAMEDTATSPSLKQEAGPYQTLNAGA